MRPTLDTRRLNALHLFGLSCAAIAQPIFDLLGRNGEFFVASRSGAIEILALTLALIAGVPGLLVLVELAAGAISERLRHAVHLTIVAMLMIAIALPIARHLLPPRDVLIVIVSVALGILGAVAYARAAAARQIASWLAALMILAPANFLLHSDVTKTLLPSRATSTLGTVAADTPVVVIIFDELPLASLLDDQLQIDAARYPNFAGLAAGAYWFRNATSVSEATMHAVPAILSGRKPDLSLLATARDHPDSVYSWLGRSYRVESREPVTAICPGIVCADRNDRPHSAKLAAMASDVAVVLGHALMPPGVAAHSLPRIDQTWHGFGGRGSANRLSSMPMPEEDGSTRDVTITSNPKSLYVLHFLLPHVPWHYLPGGRIYGLSQDIPGLEADEHWVNNPLAVVEGYQRHLLQVGYADRVLGEVLGRLRSARIFDDAMVIVAADHGCSFRPGDNRRQLTPTNWTDVLRVPLLVKVPSQRAGITSDRAVQTIDILPTISTVLHAPLPFAVDGVSMLPDVDRPPVKRTAIYGASQAFPVPNDLTGLREAAARKTSLFGSGADIRKLFGRGRFWRLVGEPVARLQVNWAVDLKATIAEAERFATVAPDTGSVPALVAGSVTGSATHSGDAVVAVALNGIVRAVAPLTRFGQNDAFQIVLPETAFTNGRNDLQILLVDGPEAQPRVASAPLTDSDYRLVSSGGVEHLESAGRMVPVTPGALAGFVDRTSSTDVSGYLSAWGWVADNAHAGLPGILVFADGRQVAAGGPTADRPDVATAVGDPRSVRSGYVVHVRLGSLTGARTVRVFGVSGRGVASELGYPSDFPYLAEMHYTLVASGGREHLELPNGTVPVERTAIRGYVDTWSWSRVDEQDYLSVSGWAASPSRAEPISVILFADDRPVAAVHPTVPRPDVAQLLKDERARQSGFTFRIRIESAVQARRLRVFGVSGRRAASELSFAAGVTPGPAVWQDTH